jgi:UDP-N-acetylmuramate dehydrogenase
MRRASGLFAASRAAHPQTEMQIEKDVPLAQFTTLGIGGPARLYTRVRDIDSLREALMYAAAEGCDVLILGGGSNMLISDDGFKGLVVHVDLRGVEVESLDEYAMVRVAAGEPWDEFVAMTTAKGWAGVECLSGIPGSTGATPIQNVGAYGQEVSDTIARVEALDRNSGTVVTLTSEECRFGYRSSIFKTSERERYVVTAVTFRLRVGGEATVRYPELRQALDAAGADLGDLEAVRRTVIAIRKKKGMVVDPADPDSKSDGSFFMNPVLTAAEFAAFEERARARVGAEAKIPSFPAGESVKLSAAWLIEQSGFHKGLTHRNVGLSSKHTLAVINRGGGTAAEVVELVERIREGVREAFAVELHPEPNFIGFDPAG